MANLICFAKCARRGHRQIRIEHSGGSPTSSLSLAKWPHRRRRRLLTRRRLAMIDREVEAVVIWWPCALPRSSNASDLECPIFEAECRERLAS